MARGGIRRTPTLVARAKELYESGWSTDRIGRELEVSSPTVVRWLYRAGVSLRSQREARSQAGHRAPGSRGGVRRTPELLARTKTLYEAGWSTARIGAEVGVSPVTVLRWIDRMGVPQRPWFRPDVSTSYIADRLRSGATYAELSKETGMSDGALRRRYASWLADQAEFDAMCGGSE